jgi:enamine deaminase RidA (YjgF/YER057c/UK114 family)
MEADERDRGVGDSIFHSRSSIIRARIANSAIPGTATMNLTQKLQSLNITLPPVSGPFGAYVPAKRVGNLIYVAGQLPMKDGKLLATGQIPSRCSIDDARAAARQCVINCIAAVQMLSGGIDSIVGVARVGAFVSSDTTFTEQPKVADSASELLKEIFGPAGQHARASVGVNTLPRDASVEIEIIFEAGS